MIIGNGSIANIFLKEYYDNNSILIFASGVSNSNEKKRSQFHREKKLLQNTIKKYSDYKIVYFSSVYSQHVDTEYYKHKKNMESLILKNCKNYLILRLPQLISDKGNNNNLVNHLVNSILNCQNLEIQNNVKRSIIDIDDVKLLTIEIIKNYNNKIFNISMIQSMFVIDICKIISNIKGITPKITIVPPLFIPPELNNSPEIDQIIDNLKIDRKDYINKILKKYIKQ